MAASSTILALDVGEKRIGVAYADTSMRIPVARGIIEMGASTLEHVAKAYREIDASLIVVGLPRNSQGEETAQSEYVRRFADTLSSEGYDVMFQDESLTSVLAEDYLKQSGKPYGKGDIDARAAAMILEDYLESHYA